MINEKALLMRLEGLEETIKLVEEDIRAIRDDRQGLRQKQLDIMETTLECKERIATLETYLEKVFVLLKNGIGRIDEIDKIDKTTEEGQEMRKIGLGEWKQEMEKKLREFRRDLECR